MTQPIYQISGGRIPLKSSVFTTGDVGEQGDKGSTGKAIDGPTGDQGYQGMWR